MTHAPLLQSRAMLDRVLSATNAKQTAPDQWLGHCPAHGSQRHRDFSIKCTPERILLYCFASCSSEAVCHSLGLSLADLFLEPRQATYVPYSMPRLKRMDRTKLAFQFELGALDRRRRADRVLACLQGLDEDLTDLDRNTLMAIAARAYEDRDKAAWYEDFADHLRARARRP